MPRRCLHFLRPTVVAPIWAADNTLVHEDGISESRPSLEL